MAPLLWKVWLHLDRGKGYVIIFGLPMISLTNVVVVDVWTEVAPRAVRLFGISRVDPTYYEDDIIASASTGSNADGGESGVL